MVAAFPLIEGSQGNKEEKDLGRSVSSRAHKGSSGTFVLVQTHLFVASDTYGTDEAMRDIMLPPNRDNADYPYDSVWAKTKDHDGSVDHRENIIYNGAQREKVSGRHCNQNYGGKRHQRFDRG